MQNNVETEIKLLIAKKHVKTLMASSLVAKKTKKGSHKTVKLVNIYFDTRDLLLQQAGIAYRVRQNGKKYEATVKLGRSEAGGLSARQEYNVTVENAKPEPEVIKETDKERLNQVIAYRVVIILAAISSVALLAFIVYRLWDLLS